CRSFKHEGGEVMSCILTEALTLLKGGFIPLWVEPGTKAAKHLGWSQEQPTEESVRRAFSRPSNLGVRCGDVHADGTCLLAIDVDVNDHELIRCVEHAIGIQVPTKTGKKGATYFVRTDYEQKSTKIKL